MISQPIAIASLVPGRAAGRLETDAARSGAGCILMVGQAQLDSVAALPDGLIIVDPAPFSHAVIRWCSRGIPVGMLSAEQAAGLAAGDVVLLDTVAGLLQPAVPGMRPDAWQPPPPAATPLRAADGIPVQLGASVADIDAAGRANAAGAAALGLVRSEYLVPADGSQPDAAFYRQTFAALLEAAGGLPVTIRLLDLSADKLPAWLGKVTERSVGAGLHGSQLFGLDAVRDIVRRQLDTLSAVPGSRLRLLWPSGGRLEDFRNWRQTLDLDVPVGAMLESPIETLAVDAWLEHADFVAIGCNDLLQHLNGAQRDLPAHRKLLDPYRPELFRFLHDVAGRAGPGLDRIQLCGLLPQVEGVLPVLLGLGFCSFSVEPALLPLLAVEAQRLTMEACRSLAEQVVAAREASDARERLGLDPSVPWSLAHHTDWRA